LNGLDGMCDGHIERVKASGPREQERDAKTRDRSEECESTGRKHLRLCPVLLRRRIESACHDKSPSMCGDRWSNNGDPTLKSPVDSINFAKSLSSIMRGSARMRAVGATLAGDHCDNATGPLCLARVGNRTFTRGVAVPVTEKSAAFLRLTEC